MKTEHFGCKIIKLRRELRDFLPEIRFCVSLHFSNAGRC